MAVIEKRAGLQVGDQDAYVNIAGGIKVNEPALDLATVMAIISSFRNKSVDLPTFAGANGFKLLDGKLYLTMDGTIIGEGVTLPTGGGGGGGGGGSHFKYGIVFDNGADGTPSNVTYIGDCAGFTPAVGSNLGSWAGTKLLTEYFRPCVIGPEDTEPKYYLNPAVLTQKMDGTSAVLTGADGDVMVQVKKLYGKFVNNGTSITAYISDQKEDDTWFCWTEMNGIEQEYAYRGRYMAGVASGAGTVMRSISLPRTLRNSSNNFPNLNILFNSVPVVSIKKSTSLASFAVPRAYEPKI